MDDKLSQEEQEILRSYRNGEWETIPKFHEQLEAYRKTASNSLKKDKRVNIRISNRDLIEIRRLAAHEGIPYQTFISSILHKFVNGRLVVKV